MGEERQGSYLMTSGNLYRSKNCPRGTAGKTTQREKNFRRLCWEVRVFSPRKVLNSKTRQGGSLSHQQKDTPFVCSLLEASCEKQWRLFIIISRESKWGTLKSTGNPQFLQKFTRFALIAVTSARPRVCKCPPPQIPVSQSPF